MSPFLGTPGNMLVCGFFGPREASVLGFRTSTGGHDAHWQADSSGQEAGARARAVSRVSSARSMVPWSALGWKPEAAPSTAAASGLGN